MEIVEKIYRSREFDAKLFSMLIDPDRQSPDEAARRANAAERAGVDFILVGGSVIRRGSPAATVGKMRERCSLPIILFPGVDHPSVSLVAGAVGFLCPAIMNSGCRIDMDMWYEAALPIMERYSLRSIPMAYILVDSGGRTTAQDVTGVLPTSRDSPADAAQLTAIGELRGQRLVYLDGGSGARRAVPCPMIEAVRARTTIPIIVGGGLRSAEDVAKKVDHGADIIVVGTALEQNCTNAFLAELVAAAHGESKSDSFSSGRA